MTDPAVSRPQDFPRQAIADLVAWLDAAGARWTLVGGLAASLLGAPRYTRDLDAIVLMNEEHLDSFIAAGAVFGFVPAVDDSTQFALDTRVVLMTHLPTHMDVDLLLASLSCHLDAVENSQVVRLSGTTFPLVSVEDLVVLKAIARRPVDISDIRNVLDSHPRIRLRRVRDSLAAIADVMEQPTLVDEFNRIVKDWRRDRAAEATR